MNKHLQKGQHEKEGRAARAGEIREWERRWRGELGGTRRERRIARERVAACFSV